MTAPTARPPVTPSRVDAESRRTLAAGLRVAIFSETWLPQVNGVTRTLDRLLNAVIARGGEARAFTTTDPAAKPDPRVVRYRSRPFWAYPELRIARPDRAWATRQLEGFAPTLVHAATPFGLGLSGRAAARDLGVPFVTSYHTSLSAYAKFYHLGALAAPGWAYLRWFHNSGLRTYVPTRAIQRELDAHGFTNTAIWSRGIDAERFSPRFRSAALRRELGVDDDTVLVAYIGRIAIEKGIDTLVESMHAVRARAGGRRVAFVLAGDGPYLAKCREDVPDGTIFTGMITGDRLSSLYASADLFVFPSVTDTFGNVLLEAMASGLPVLGADAPPTRELLGDDRGVIFPAGDPDALAQAILALAADPARRAQQAGLGLAYAAGRSWDAIFDELIMDYRQVVQSSPALAVSA
ncbi:MAG: glycosyltransferase family 1 protein [Gemmatimonadetes bacterium]|nr:glycosyltransferase family 1 protein [Gemmatimonadota bacterium]